MKTVLLDTNILVEIVRGSPRARKALQRAGLLDGAARGLIPAVCAGELLAMRERNAWGGAKQEAQERLLEEIPVAPIARPEVWTAYAPRLSPHAAKNSICVSLRSPPSRVAKCRSTSGTG